MKTENENTIYTMSAKLDKDKFEMDLLKAKCRKEGLNFSQTIIKLVRLYNSDNTILKGKK